VRWERGTLGLLNAIFNAPHDPMETWRLLKSDKYPIESDTKLEAYLECLLASRSEFVRQTNTLVYAQEYPGCKYQGLKKKIVTFSEKWSWYNRSPFVSALHGWKNSRPNSSMDWISVWISGISKTLVSMYRYIDFHRFTDIRDMIRYP